MLIRAINGRYGGASHDSHVWSLSEERNYLKRNFENGDKSSWIIGMHVTIGEINMYNAIIIIKKFVFISGDSGYPLEPWLLTPFRSPSDNSSESNFNNRFTIARSLIERTFGVMKARFRCLLSARELHYSPEKATQILNVCCALHNICLKYNVEMPVQIQIDADDETTCYDLNQHDIPQNVELSNTAKAIRNQIKNNLLT